MREMKKMYVSCGEFAPVCTYICLSASLFCFPLPNLLLPLSLLRHFISHLSRAGIHRYSQAFTLPLDWKMEFIAVSCPIYSSVLISAPFATATTVQDPINGETPFLNGDHQSINQSFWNVSLRCRAALSLAWMASVVYQLYLIETVLIRRKPPLSLSPPLQRLPPFAILTTTP